MTPSYGGLAFEFVVSFFNKEAILEKIVKRLVEGHEPLHGRINRRRLLPPVDGIVSCASCETCGALLNGGKALGNSAGVCLNLKSLTSMRGVAALLVFTLHLRFPALAPVASQGRLGVSFFFILSGVVLAWVWKPGESPKSFYRRRVARIYPVYIVALVAGAIVSYALADGSGDSLGGMLGVFLLQSWIPDSGVYFAWNGVSWSLSVEAFFYLIFPLIAPFTVSTSRRLRHTLQIVAVAVICALGVYAAISMPSPAFSYYLPNTFEAWLTFVLPLSRLAEFVLGTTLVATIRGDRLPIRKSLAVALLLVSYVFASLNPTGLGLAAVSVVPICLFIVVFAQADAAGETSVLHNRMLLSVGESSYCFYLVHQIVIRLEKNLVPVHSAWLDGLGMVGALGVSLSLAYVLHRYVEKPLYERFKGRVRASVPNEGVEVGTLAGR